MIESSKKVKPWREAVRWAVIEQFQDAPRPLLKGPVTVGIVFMLPRPVSAKKSDRVPSRKPDIDKLVRSTLDALSESAVFEDDARVVDLYASKAYAIGHAPGAVITVSEWEGKERP